ncbi:MAG: acyloxyacyl hydrolase [Bacteroidota bacterium]
MIATLVVILVLLGFWGLPAASAQEGTMPTKGLRKLGFTFAYGNQDLLAVDYHYRFGAINLQYYHGLINRRNWDLELLVQPLLVSTRFISLRDINDRRRGFEFGANLSILARKKLWEDRLSCYAYVGYGPHFVNDVIERQREGFLFTNNYFVGVDIRLEKNLVLDLSYGFRHISNANLMQPNAGVNNVVYTLGFILDWPQ